MGNPRLIGSVAPEYTTLKLAALLLSELNPAEINSIYIHIYIHICRACTAGKFVGRLLIDHTDSRLVNGVSTLKIAEYMQVFSEIPIRSIV